MAKDGYKEHLKGHFRGSCGKTPEGGLESCGEQSDRVMLGRWLFTKGQTEV